MKIGELIDKIYKDESSEIRNQKGWITERSSYSGKKWVRDRMINCIKDEAEVLAYGNTTPRFHIKYGINIAKTYHITHIFVLRCKDGLIYSFRGFPDYGVWLAKRMIWEYEDTEHAIRYIDLGKWTEKYISDEVKGEKGFGLTNSWKILVNVDFLMVCEKATNKIARAKSPVESMKSIYKDALGGLTRVRYINSRPLLEDVDVAIYTIRVYKDKSGNYRCRAINTLNHNGEKVKFQALLAEINRKLSFIDKLSSCVTEFVTAYDIEDSLQRKVWGDKYVCYVNVDPYDEGMKLIEHCATVEALSGVVK